MEERRKERKVTADPSMCLTRCSILSLVHFSAVRLGYNTFPTSTGNKLVCYVGRALSPSRDSPSRPRQKETEDRYLSYFFIACFDTRDHPPSEWVLKISPVRKREGERGRERQRQKVLWLYPDVTYRSS